MKHLKTEFDKLTIKEFIVFVLALLFSAAGLTLLFMALFIPPEGEIHESVLTAFGIVSLFVASLLGISFHYHSELDKFKTSIQDKLKSLTGKEDKCEDSEQ